MKPRPTRAAPALALALALLALASPAFTNGANGAEGDGARRPSILLVLADDLGYGDVACYNPESKVPTPHLDRLAAQGLRFTDAHSPSTVCTPTRYSLLTGRMAFRNGMRGVFTGAGGPCLIEEGRITLPAMLRGRGYTTALFGKWHVGLTFYDVEGQPIHRNGLEAVRRIDYTRPVTDGPLHRGFDTFFGTACCPTTDWLYAYIEGDRIPVPPTHIVDRGPLPKHPYSRDNRPGMIAPGFDLEEVDVVFLEKSIAFLREHAADRPEKPFFLFHSAQAVHLPSFPGDAFKGKTGAGPHGDFIFEFDHVVGELTAELDRLGLAENTLVIVTSDNGPETTSVVHMRRDHGHDGARPWRGMKRDNWEGGHRVPLIARWPGVIAPGRTTDQTVCLTDLMATCATIVGSPLPANAAEDSFNLLPVLEGKVAEERPVREFTLHQTISLALAIRRGPWKYLDHRGSGGNRYDRGRLRPFVIDDRSGDAPAQLYHLGEDPGETGNRFARHPEVAAELKAQLDTFKAAGRSAPVLTAGSLAGPARPAKTYPIEDFLDSTRVRGASFSPDNRKVLVGSDVSGIFNVQAIPVDGGDPVPLTRSGTESFYAEAYFPGDERFLYSSDEGGNELDHIYVQELDGTVRDLTPGENLKARFGGFSRDGKTFYISTNERDRRYFDLYEYQAEGYTRQLIYQNNEGYSFAFASPDRRTVALAKSHTRDDSDIFLFDVGSGKTRHLTPHEGDINHRPLDFAPDGHSLLISTDRGSDFSYLATVDLTGEGDAKPAIEPLIKFDWDVPYAYYSTGGKYLVVLVNEDASNDLHLYDAVTLEEVELPAVADAEVTSVEISRDDRHLAFYVSSGRRPRDLYYYDLTTREPPRQLTRTLSAKIDPGDLVEGAVVRFTSFDGVEIPGILYLPQAAAPDRRVPALVWVHGGPGGQSRVGFSALIQYLVNHGYAVYAINNRGSSGYGKRFQQLDDRKHGEGDLDDCVTAKVMLAATGVIDPERIGIIGGSYGGYMTLAALAFRPGEFNVGVDIFGVSNWVRTLASIPAWWESARKSLQNEMGDFDDVDYLKSISPLFHAEKIRRPLLVLQGANDPRVLRAESDEIVAAVKKNNVPVEYVVFDDEGHGFAKKANRARGYRAIRTFLDEYLKATPR